MKLVELFEARKNPELNPRLSAYEQLSDYKRDPHAYIHFSNENKLGINPNEKVYNGEKVTQTPLGIYAYPLKESWKHYKVDHSQSFMEFPHSKKKPFILLFKYDKPLVDVSKYKNLEEDTANLQAKYSHLINVDEALEKAKHEVYNPAQFQIFWRLTHNVAQQLHPEHVSHQWNTVLRALGYDGFHDKYGKGWLHHSEPVQSVLLKYQNIEVLDMVLNKDYRNLKTESMDIDSPAELVDIIKDKTTKIRNVLMSIDDSLITYLHKYLQQVSDSGRLMQFINNRPPTDMKLLLLIWLNGHANISHQDHHMIEHIKRTFDAPSDKILAYAKHIAKIKWHDDIIIHNLDLLKTL